MEEISLTKTPTSTEELRRFLGAVKFYRRFILGCLGLADTLFRLIRGRASFSWVPKQKAAFALLIQVLYTAPLLWFLDWSKIIYIETNASQFRIGAVLTHEAEPDIQLPSGFASWTLQPAERQY